MRHLTLVALGGLMVGSGVASAKSRIAVLGFEAAAPATVATSELATELSIQFQLQPASSRSLHEPADPTTDDLPTLKANARCPTASLYCMQGLARQLHADAMLWGKVEPSGTGFKISITVLELAPRSTMRTAVEQLEQDFSTGVAVARWSEDMYRKVTDPQARSTPPPYVRPTAPPPRPTTPVAPSTPAPRPVDPFARRPATPAPSPYDAKRPAPRPSKHVPDPDPGLLDPFSTSRGGRRPMSPASSPAAKVTFVDAQAIDGVAGSATFARALDGELRKLLAGKPDVAPAKRLPCSTRVPACLAQIGAAAGARTVVYATVETVNGGYHVTTKVVDVAKRALVDVTIQRGYTAPATAREVVRVVGIRSVETSGLPLDLIPL